MFLTTMPRLPAIMYSILCPISARVRVIWPSVLYLEIKRGRGKLYILILNHKVYNTGWRASIAFKTPCAQTRKPHRIAVYKYVIIPPFEGVSRARVWFLRNNFGHATIPDFGWKPILCYIPPSERVYVFSPQPRPSCEAYIILCTPRCYGSAWSWYKPLLRVSSPGVVIRWIWDRKPLVMRICLRDVLLSPLPKKSRGNDTRTSARVRKYSSDTYSNIVLIYTISPLDDEKGLNVCKINFFINSLINNLFLNLLYEVSILYNSTFEILKIK